MKFRVLIYFFFIFQTTYCQQDTLTKKLKSVDVSATNSLKGVESVAPTQTLSTSQLFALPILQISDAISFFSGAVVRDYGGVGGMKTVAVRGLGAQHTGLILDQIPVSDAKTGQIDLSRFSTNNLAEVSLICGQGDSLFVSAKQLSYGALIYINSQKPAFYTNKPINIIFELTGGSFGLINPYFYISNRIKKKKNPQDWGVSSSIQVNYLQSKGDYPFTLFYGNATDSTSRERRQNADYKTINTEGNLFFDIKKNSKISLKVYYEHSERGLPGAVIYYNEKAGQRLWEDMLFAQIQYVQLFNKGFKYQLQAKANFANTRYLDTSFLNSAGKLENRYYQQEFYISNIGNYQYKKLQINVANDIIYNDLFSTMANFNNPARFSVLTSLAAKFSHKWAMLSGSLLYTYVSDYQKKTKQSQSHNDFSGSVIASFKPISAEEFRLRAFAKNSFRLPTFNDLYYRDIISVTPLRPERTWQFDIGATYKPKFRAKKISLSATVDYYYNIVTDKIVAMPTQNLFIWAMINYGKVTVNGIDANVDISFKITPKLTFTMFGNYTFQEALDKTDKSSKTYNQQLPYTPKHSGNVGATIITPWLDFFYSVQISGKRYSLGQNTLQNELQRYADQTIGIGKRYPINSKKSSSEFQNFVLGFKAELLNITNLQYQIVRFYPMPGRQFRVKLFFKW